MMASTSPTERSPCHNSRPSPPATATAATTSCSQFEPGKTTTPTFIARSFDRHLRVFDDRIRQEALAQVVDASASRVLVGRLHREPDRLTDLDALDAVKAQRGERALDGRALRVSDTRPQRDFHEHRKRGHRDFVTPGQSAKVRPVSRSYAST